jgi:hypothetical protein
MALYDSCMVVCIMCRSFHLYNSANLMLYPYKAVASLHVKVLCIELLHMLKQTHCKDDMLLM